MATEKGQIKDAFAGFFENPSKETLRHLLQNNFGETGALDFKEQWPGHPSLAKHVLGMANTGPGCLIVGVTEKPDKSLDPIGLSALTDKADITNGLKRYLPSELMTRFQVLDFAFDSAEYAKIIGKSFQVMLVTYSPDHTPFVSLRAGDGIRANAIYIRREGITEEAGHDELQRILNRRIESAYSTADELDLKNQLEQLRTLYGAVRQHLSGLHALGLTFFQTRNPAAPSESFDAFINQMIQAKKRSIAKLLGVPYLQRSSPPEQTGEVVASRARKKAAT